MKSRVACLFAVLIVALAVLGFSYAWWTETLTISGTITTGELDVGFANNSTSCSDYITCKAILIDSDSDNDYDKMEVTVGNAYPCGWCNVTFAIANTGTIPAKIGNVELNYNTTALDVSLTDATGASIIGKTIGVGSSLGCKLAIHVKEDADELKSYTVTVTINVKQFNAP
ncbi:MAG: SipW-dependent-type signal peptide-containing protein [Candidatus Bathyarchaeia archaeon]